VSAQGPWILAFCPRQTGGNSVGSEQGMVWPGNPATITRAQWQTVAAAGMKWKHNGPSNHPATRSKSSVLMMQSNDLAEYAFWIFKMYGQF
jgi:hypothetical protein